MQAEAEVLLDSLLLSTNKDETEAKPEPTSSQLFSCPGQHLQQPRASSASAPLGSAALRHCLQTAASASSSSTSASASRLSRVAVLSSTSGVSVTAVTFAVLQPAWCVLLLADGDELTAEQLTASATAAISKWKTEGAAAATGSSSLPDAEIARLVSLRIAYLQPAEQLSLVTSAAASDSASVSADRHKNAAYLLAVQAGADIIFDGGDDKLELLLSSNSSSAGGDGWLDSIAHTYRTASIAERQTLSPQQLPVQHQLPHLLTQSEQTEQAYAALSSHSVTARVWNHLPSLLNGTAQLSPRGLPTPLNIAAASSPPAAAASAYERHAHCLAVVQQQVVAQRPDAVPACQQPAGAAASTSLPAWALPFDSYSPVNSRSTVWLSSGFFALLLPASAPHGLADVWRSFIAETLLSYLRVSTRPFGNASTDALRAADLTLGPDRLSLSADTIEPCTVFALSPFIVAPSSADAAAHCDKEQEAAGADSNTTSRLLAFLTLRRHGHTYDLLQRVRQRLSSKQVRPAPSSAAASAAPQAPPAGISIAHLLLQLYVDLHDAALLQLDDVRSAATWAQELQRIAAWRSSTCSGASELLPSLSYRQTAMAVCINFNFPPADNSLWQLLRYHSRLHQSVAVVGPVVFSSLPAHQRHWLTALFPQVIYLAAPEVNEGISQQYSLSRCLHYFVDSTRALLSEEQGGVGSHGLLYLADDLWFDLFEVLVPREPEPDAPSSFTSRSLSRLRLSYPLSEFWYPPPVMMLNMTDPADSVSDWDLLHHNIRPFWQNLRTSHWRWPQRWRDILDGVSGVVNHTLSNAVADLVYVPCARSQLRHLLDALDAAIAVFPHPLLFSEVLLTQLIHIAMNESGLQPVVPLPTRGANYDRRYETLYYGPRNASVFYSQLIDFLASRCGSQSSASSYSTSCRLRPVPLRVDGYRWHRADMKYLEWAVLRSEGDPIFSHPIKLSDPNGRPHRIYVTGHEQLSRQLAQGKRS